MSTDEQTSSHLDDRKAARGQSSDEQVNLFEKEETISCVDGTLTRLIGRESRLTRRSSQSRKCANTN